MVKIYKQPFAHEGDAIAIPDVSQPDGKMSSTDGWTPDYQLPKTDPNYKPVGRQEMNGVFKEVTEALGQMQVQGAASWAAAGAPYPINAQVYHNGKQWLALRANSVEPAEGEDWSEWNAAMVARSIIVVNSVSEMIELLGIKVGSTVQTKGYYTAGDGGGNDYEIVAAGTGVDDGGSFIDLANGLQARGLFKGSEINQAQFGMIGSGDNATYLSNAITYAMVSGKTLIINDAVYTSEVSINVAGSLSLICTGEGKIVAHANAVVSDIYDSYLLEFGEDVNNSTFLIKLDMAGKTKSGISIAGDNCEVPYVLVENIGSTVGYSSLLSGINCSGNDTQIGTVEGRNNKSSKSVGGRGGSELTVTNYAKNVKVKRILSNSELGAYLGNGEDTAIEYIYSDGCDGNVIYSIAGSKGFYCGSLVAKNCTDELVVFSGDAEGTLITNENPYIGKIVAYNCNNGLGFNGVKNLKVGELYWYNGVGASLYSRPVGSVTVDSVEIGRITIVNTDFKDGAPIAIIDKFTVDKVYIGDLKVDLIYTNTVPPNTIRLAYLSGVSGLHLGNVDIKVSEGPGVGLTASNVFYIAFPNFTKKSSINSVSFDNNGGAYSIRIGNVAQDFLDIADEGTFFRTDLNDMIASNPSRKALFGFGAPVVGKWRRGDVIWNTSPSAGTHIGWVCISEGTPGTWKSFGVIAV